MLDAQSTNATATFYTEGDTTSPHDDPWTPHHENVRVLWDPKGTEYVNTETGEREQRADRIIAPLELSHDHEPGDRVDVLPDHVASQYGHGPYRETTYGGASPRELRITGGSDRALDGQEGYWQVTVRDTD